MLSFGDCDYCSSCGKVFNLITVCGLFTLSLSIYLNLFIVLSNALWKFSACQCRVLLFRRDTGQWSLCHRIFINTFTAESLHNLNCKIEIAQLTAIYFEYFNGLINLWKFRQSIHNGIKMGLTAILSVYLHSLVSCSMTMTNYFDGQWLLIIWFIC